MALPLGVRQKQERRPRLRAQFVIHRKRHSKIQNTQFSDIAAFGRGVSPEGHNTTCTGRRPGSGCSARSACTTRRWRALFPSSAGALTRRATCCGGGRAARRAVGKALPCSTRVGAAPMWASRRFRIRAIRASAVRSRTAQLSKLSPHGRVRRDLLQVVPTSSSYSPSSVGPISLMASVTAARTLSTNSRAK